MIGLRANVRVEEFQKGRCEHSQLSWGRPTMANDIMMSTSMPRDLEVRWAKDPRRRKLQRHSKVAVSPMRILFLCGLVFNIITERDIS